MAFDLQVWKDKLTETLIGLDLKAQAAQRKTLYGVIAASALAPVVAAVAAGDHGAAVVAAQALGGAVGGGLLTNLLQKKQDAVDAEWTIADPADLAAKAAADADLRADLDAMLTKLDAMRIASDSLSEGDRAWFAEALKRELKPLGNHKVYKAVLKGGGAIAQGKGARSVGKGGVYIGGKNSGNVNTGKQINTGGGAYVNGDVRADGDFVGRDKIVHIHGAGAEDMASPISPEAQALYALLSGPRFNLDDLKDLAYTLGIDWDALSGEAKPAKARELARACDTPALLPRLRRAIRMLRPGIDQEEE